MNQKIKRKIKRICVTVWDLGSNWNDVAKKNDVKITHQMLWYLSEISQMYCKNC